MVRVHIVDEIEGMELEMCFENVDALGDAMYHIKYLFNTANPADTKLDAADKVINPAMIIPASEAAKPINLDVALAPLRL